MAIFLGVATEKSLKKETRKQRKSDRTKRTSIRQALLAAARARGQKR
jgi:hypothetical protein